MPSPLPPAAETLGQHVEFVRTLASALLRGDSESEDLAQDVLASALEGPARAPEHQRSWLARALRHRALDLLRGRARRRARERAVARPDVVAQSMDPVEQAETGRRLVAAVLALPEPGRTTLLLRYQHELSPPAVAERLGVPVETVRSRLRRGLAQLRAALEAQGEAGGHSWSAGLAPLLLGPRPGRWLSRLEVALGGATVSKYVLVPVLLVLGLGGYGALLIAEISREVDELRRGQVLPAARREGSAAAAPPSASTPSPLLEGAPPPSESVRIDRLERLVERLVADAQHRETAWRELEQVLAEITLARIGANETAAVAVSRNVISAMAQAQVSARADEDADGTGEYLGFFEASGAGPGRMARPLVPPVLSGAFRLLTTHGEVVRSGYVFRVYLPDARGAGVGEASTGFAPGLVSPDLAETTWCLYAWPEHHGKTGTRTFFVNQGGDVLASENAAYSGSGRGPEADAAFLPVHRGFILGLPAIGAVGCDGGVWKQIN